MMIVDNFQHIKKYFAESFVHQGGGKLIRRCLTSIRRGSVTEAASLHYTDNSKTPHGYEL